MLGNTPSTASTHSLPVFRSLSLIPVTVTLPMISSTSVSLMTFTLARFVTRCLRSGLPVKSSVTITAITSLAYLVSVRIFSRAVLPPPTTATLSFLKNAASHVPQKAIPLPCSSFAPGTERFLRVAPVAMIIAFVKNTVSPLIVFAVSLYILPAASATDAIGPFTMERYSGNFLCRFSKNETIPSWKASPDKVGTNGQLVISAVLFIWPPTSGPTAITLRWASSKYTSADNPAGPTPMTATSYIFFIVMFSIPYPLSTAKIGLRKAFYNGEQTM